ncbi:MAG: hypothetical protein AAGB51_12485 [Planctomycetota bacterium]
MFQTSISVRARSAAALIAAAAAFSLAAPALGGTVPGAPTLAGSLDGAAAMIESGQHGLARESIVALLADGTVVSDSDARSRAYSLLGEAVAGLGTLSQSEQLTQAAEADIAAGRLDEAETKLREATITPDAPVRLPRLLGVISEMRAEAALALPGLITDAEAAFEMGQTELARDLLDEARDSGAAKFGPLAGRMRDLGRRIDGTPSEPVVSPAVIQASIERQDQPAADPNADLIQQTRRLEAQSLFAEANSDMTERRWASAEAKFSRLLGEYRSYLSDTQAEEAEGRLAEARALLQTDQADEDVLSDIRQDREIAKQQATAEFDNELEQANRALDSGDVGRARELAVEARQTAQGARNLFAESEFENLQSRVDALLTTIEIREEAIRDQQRQDRERELVRETAERERLRSEERETRINEAIDRVRALQAERKYDEALQVVDEILFLDPNDPSGLLLRDIISNIRAYTRYDQLGREAQTSYMRQAVENRIATIAPENTVNFPEDWPERSLRRIGAANDYEPIENRRVLQSINDRRINVAFRDNTLEEVIQFIEAVSQLDIDVDWDALEEISIGRDTPISLTLNNPTLRVVLDRVMSKASAAGFGEQADWAVIDGVLTVSSDSRLRLNTRLEIYDIRDLIVEVPDYEDAPDLDLNTALQSGQGGGGQSPFQDGGDEDPERRTFQERVDELIEIIRNNVDSDGWLQNGGDTGRIEQLNGNLIITNTPKNHRRIRSLLSQLRAAQALQINVEARFLLVSQDFFEQIGFDLDVYFNADNNQVRTAQAGNPAITASDFFDFTTAPVGLQNTVPGGENFFQTDPATGQIVLDDNDQPITITPNPSSVIPPEDGFSPVAAAQNSLGLVGALAPQSGIAATVLAGSPALGVAGTFLDDIQVDFLVQATQADTRSVTLTAPRVTFTNGQRTNFFVATQQTFVSDLTPIVSDSAVGFDPEIEVVTEGAVLDVRGTVSADRRYVTLDVTTGTSTIDGFGTQAVTAVAGGQLVSSADTAAFVQLPTVSVTNVSTTVQVPDQGTVLLGGQRIVNESEVETGVPVLSKMPILNRFFSNRLEVLEESTLMVLIKPTILIQNEQEEQNFPGLLDQLEFGGIN